MRPFVRGRKIAQVNSTRFLVTLALLMLWAPSVPAREVPESLRGLAIGAEYMRQTETELSGEPFVGLIRRSDVPYLLWPTGQATVRQDQKTVIEWLRDSAAALGHHDFEPRLVEVFEFRGNEAWSYGLSRKGIPLDDARVVLLWHDGHLVGLVNDVPAPIYLIEDSGPGRANVDSVYTAVGQKDGYTLGLGSRQQTVEGNGISSTIQIGDQVVQRVVETTGRATRNTYTFQSWDVVPEGGAFPDQIDIDSNGVVWFSDPTADRIFSFDPSTETFGGVPAVETAGLSPDGLMVAANDVVWTGLITAGAGLGEYNIATQTFNTYDGPVPVSALAIPNETQKGTIWVSEHSFADNNRYSEFRPSLPPPSPPTHAWVRSIAAPSGSYVVAGTENTDTKDVYFSMLLADKLGKLPPSGTTYADVQEINVGANVGPGFVIYSRGHVYFSETGKNRLGDYDVATETVTHYTFPGTSSMEFGGPLDVLPCGTTRLSNLIAVGTTGDGYIMVFDPGTQSFESYPTPTTAPGLKDGLRSDSTGKIWFTETNTKKIAVLDRGVACIDPEEICPERILCGGGLPSCNIRPTTQCSTLPTTQDHCYQNDTLYECPKGQVILRYVCFCDTDPGGQTFCPQQSQSWYCGIPPWGP